MVRESTAPIASMDDLGSRLEFGLDDVGQEHYDYDRDFAPDAEREKEESEKRSKYHHAMQTLKPVRPRNRKQFPLHQAGLFSYMTYHWITGFVWGVYKKGTVEPERLWTCPERDGCSHNAKRFERLWQEELRAQGVEEASVFRVMLRFIRTRVIVSFLVQLCTLTFSVIGPAILVKAILDYNRDLEDKRLWYGLSLVLAYCVSEILKVTFFVTQWLINYTSAMRLRGGVLEVIYLKLLRIRSLKDKTVGQFVNIFTNDGQRLIEACATGPLVLGGPIVAVVATVYCCFLLSPWALIGTLVFALFYPYQFLIARLTAYLRRLGIRTTDKRVRMMLEILTSIKLIKLYAWEKAFSLKIGGIRSQERSVLEKAAYVHTMSVAFLPMVPVFASVLTFIAHTLAGNDLSPAQAFVVLSLYIGSLRQTLIFVTLFVQGQSNARVASERFKVATGCHA